MSDQKIHFQAEVSRLLEIVTHSLYSEREIFLRELISNASDACDKLRYLSLTQPEIAEKITDFKIKIEADKDKKTLKITDNGIGMNHDDLIEHLGTIAKSGTSAFVKSLSGDEKKDVSLIGQFGVGFYSAFMVADKVEVFSKKAGEDQAWHWVSEGKDSFALSETDKAEYGTEILLHLKKDALEFAEKVRLEHIIKKYSDHIALPVIFIDGAEEVALNEANALWTKPKSDITDEQYAEFYRHTTHHFDAPYATLHWQTEGMIEYLSLLFIPTEKPFDLFNSERKNKIKLYVNRVFISDDVQEILPPYLRFVQGIVDSSDLPLNVSREMLQNNPLLAKIKSGLMKKVFEELKKRSEDKDQIEAYERFWTNFGAVFKEGLYEDAVNKEKIMPLVRFYSSEKEGFISLDDYLSAKKKDQNAIYYLSGEKLEELQKSPYLEGFKSRKINVLLFVDPVDEFWVTQVAKYKDVEFKSITKAGHDLEAVEKDKKKDTKKKEEVNIDKFIAFAKIELKDQVKDIRATSRLTESLSILSSDEGDMDVNLEKLLKQNNGLQMPTKRVLEINANHPLMAKVNAIADDKTRQNDLSNIAWMLFDQARLTEGEPVSDLQAFQKRMGQILLKIL
jgi:molecular chaperone HtpG